MNDISSGLGVGGCGSDDFSINIQPSEMPKISQGKPIGFGKRGIRYDERCEICSKTTDVCNGCGCCRKHCEC